MLFKFIENLQRFLLPVACNETTLVRDDFNACKQAIGRVVSAVPGVLDVVLFTLEYINSAKLSKPVRRLEAAVIRGVLKKPTEGPIYKALLECEQAEQQKEYEAIQEILKLGRADVAEKFDALARDIQTHAKQFGEYRAIRQALSDGIFSEETKASLRHALEHKQLIADAIVARVRPTVPVYVDKKLTGVLDALRAGLEAGENVDAAAKYLKQTRDVCSSDPAIKALL